MGGLAPMWIDYAYDTQTGNRTGVTTHSSTGTVSSGSYTYPAAGAARPHAVTGVAGPASFQPGTYGYDAAGNMTTRPGQQATFNEVGKVSKVVTGSATQTNIYHADGSLLLRVSSIEGASLTVGDTVLTQVAGSSVVAGFRTYSGAEGKPVAQRSAKTGTTGTTMTWLFSNLEGSVDTQTVANTGVTQRNYRDPYGAPITLVGGAWADGNGYMNKPATASTGLTTVGARTYDPVLGKFLSVDPVIDTNLPQQNTGYTYSGNSPITLSDPTGMKFSIDGYKTPATYSKPPGYYSVKAEGQRNINAGSKLMKENPYNLLNPRGKNELFFKGYALYDYGNALSTEQGALVYQWVRGKLPSTISFNSQSDITKGLRDSKAAAEYRALLRKWLSRGESLDTHYYRAGDFSLDNPNVVGDLVTMAFWEQSTNSERSLAVVGSHGYTANLVTSLTDSSAVVQITAQNPMTLGSLLSPIRGFADSLPGETGAFSAVEMSFTWTETISW